MAITPVENFYKETIAQDWPVGTGNFYVSTKPTVTAGRFVISPSSSTLREIVTYTAVGTDGTGDYVTVSARGIGGTTEQIHVIGETVRNNVTAETIQEISDSMPLISSGTTAPSSTPEKVGDVYLDTTAKKVYFATGTTDENDWTIVN
jgi:hypothetical protein